MLQKILVSGVLLVTVYFAQCQNRPNIIFILADDLGWGDLPMYGNQFNETPNLESMAKKGALYTNAYAAAPVCTPTRASIFSGQYPARIGIIDFIPGHWRPFESVIVPQNRTQYLPPEVFTIGEAMKQSGYRTGYFGRWNLGDSAIHQPSLQGFDITNTGRSQNKANDKQSNQVKKKIRTSETLAELSESFINDNKNHPFFLFVGSYDVHIPLNADSALISKYLSKPKVKNYPCNAVYAAMIDHMDQMVGRILAKVAEAGLEDNTVIVFFSDNGGLDKNFGRGPIPVVNKQHLPVGDSSLYLVKSNNPLKGSKGNLYEGGIRVPMIVQYPKKWKNRTKVNDLVTSVDFFPTFVGLSGGKLPLGQVYDGVDIFHSDVTKSRPIFWHYPVFHHGVPSSAVLLGDWKLIRNLVDSSYELYNIKEDIAETSNLAFTQPAQVAKLADLLDHWLKEVNASIPVANPDFDEKRRFKWGEHPAKNNQEE